MKTLNTSERIMSLILRKSVSDFLALAKDWSEPDWNGNLRCDWADTILQITNKSENEWLVEIYDRHFFWRQPVDPANPGGAVANIAAMLTRHDKASALARKFLGP